MPPTTEEFRVALRKRLRTAELRGYQFVEINSGQLHRQLGGYPSLIHRMRSCCDAMYEEKRQGDQLLFAPKKGHGASVTIRYSLPR